jgi:hypothetical protein
MRAVQQEHVRFNLLHTARSTIGVIMQKCVRFIIAVISLLLAGCGSSTQEDFANRVGQAMKAPANDPTSSSPLTDLRRVVFSGGTTTDSTSITPDQLFDWAEVNYPQFFPAREKTLTWSVYQFRYYKDTDVYLAVESGTKVVALGKPTKNELMTFGVMSDFSQEVLRYKPWSKVKKRVDILLSSIGIQTGESTYQIIKAADLNLDGYEDLILTGQSIYPGIPLVSNVAPNVPFHRLPVLLLYFNPTTQQFEPDSRDDRPLMYTSNGVSIQDWNRDGLLDLLFVGTGPDQGPSCGEPMVLLLNSGAGFKDRSDLLPQISYRREFVIEIDLDQDFSKDLYLLNTGANISDGLNKELCPYRQLPGTNLDLQIRAGLQGPAVSTPEINPLVKCGLGACQVMGFWQLDRDQDGKQDLLLSVYDNENRKSRLEVWRGRGPDQIMQQIQVSDWRTYMSQSITVRNGEIIVESSDPDYANSRTNYYDLRTLDWIREQSRKEYKDAGGCVEFSQVDLDGDGILDLVCRNLVRFISTNSRYPRAWLDRKGALEAIDLSVIPLDHGQSFQSVNLKGRRQFVYLGPFMSNFKSLTIYTLE